MPMPNIEDFTPMLDRACADIVGETVAYSADGGAFVSLQAHVLYRDATTTIEIAQAIEQDVSVAMLKVDVPVKPGKASRIRFGKLPGRTFRIINVRTDDAGTEWNFEVKDVSNA